jgi:hypothetical protein
MKTSIYTTLLLIASIAYSCKKPKDPKVVITVVDINEKTISGAQVRINSKTSAPGSIVDTTMTTDFQGQINYTRKFEAILEAKVTFGALSGTEYFQLKNNETTEKTIIIK